jgi:cytosine permease
VEPATTTSPPAVDALPNWLQAALGHPPVARRPWTWSLAPAYIGLFLWVVYFDQIPREALTRGSLGWAVFGCGVGAVLAFLMFYLPPALWGVETRWPLAVVATRTFGVSGVKWVPQLLLTLVQVVWLAVAIRYGTLLCLTGLKMIHLADPDWLAPSVGRGMVWPGRLFAATSFVWVYFIALAGRYLMRVIAALMNVYPAVVALILGGSMILALIGPHGAAPGGHLTRGVGLRVLPATSLPPSAAAVVTVQMILGFFATAGLFAADWGAISRDRTETKKGGLVCVAFASWIVATLAIQTVAWTRLPGEAGASPLIRPLTFCSVIPTLYGEWVGGVVFLTLSLTALAPGCYAAFLIGTRLHELFPGRTRTRWTLTGALVAWLLLMFSERVTLFGVFTVVGALIAPVAGAIAADFLKSGGRWAGARSGVNRAGMAAWAVGVVVGLAPIVTDALCRSELRYRVPAVLFAYIAAFVTYYVLAAIGAEAPTVPGLIPPAPTGTVIDEGRTT